ncbi:MAG: sugar phosphate isomerase/epimerase [Firmicutes bacterium]|nr:sugar phosphate isomerase/epimerase [Bacillota bacterium]
MEKRYIQLYSLKDETAKDFVGALKRVAEIGYTGVEFASGNYGGLAASELKVILADLGLEPLSSHIMSEFAPAHLEYAQELGLRYIIDPMNGLKDYDAALAFAETLNNVGKECKNAGISFGYHNHRHEFLPSPDGTLMDTLLKNTNPDDVCFQLDVGWATCGGCDVPAFLAKYAGRFKMIHVKECAVVAGPEPFPDFASFPRDAEGNMIIPPDVLKKFEEQNKWNVPAGTGIINWNTVRDAAVAQGAEAFIIEREFDYAGDIFKCVAEDCSFLKTL